MNGSQPHGAAAPAGSLSARTEPAFRAYRCDFATRVLAGADAPSEALLLAAHSLEKSRWLFPSSRERALYDALLEEAATADGDRRARLFIVATFFEPAYLVPFVPDFSALDDAELQIEICKLLTETPILLKYEGDAETYVRHLQRLMKLTAELELSHELKLLPEACRSALSYGVSFPPALASPENLRPLFEMRGEYLEIFTRGHSTAGVAGWSPPRRKWFRRRRVGFLVASLTASANSYYLAPYIAAARKAGCRTFLYTTKGGGVAEELSDIAEGLVVRDLDERGFSAFIQTIRADELDAIFIGGNIVGHFDPVCAISTFRLAPAQIALGANPSTTGLPSCTHFLTADTTEADTLPEIAESYSETPIVMRGLFNRFHPAMLGEWRPDEARLAALRRELTDNGRFSQVLFSNVNIVKLRREVAAVWAEILDKAPGSALVLAPFNPSWTSTAKDEYVVDRALRDMFAAHGIGTDRIRLVRPSKGIGRLRDLSEIADLYLDAWPFTSCSSLVWPLAHGCPPIVMDGRWQRARQAAAMVGSIGLERLAARTPEDYAAKAIQLLRDPEELARVSAVIQAAAAEPPWMETTVLNREFKRALKTAWAG